MNKTVLALVFALAQTFSLAAQDRTAAFEDERVELHAAEGTDYTWVDSGAAADRRLHFIGDVRFEHEVSNSIRKWVVAIRSAIHASSTR